MYHLDYKHGGDIFGAARSLNCSHEELLDFSANINPLGVSSKVTKAICENLKLIEHYPDPRCTELRASLSRYLNIPEENMLFGNGASELIYLLARTMGYNKAVICAPTFVEYGAAIASTCGAIYEITLREEDGFALPALNIKKALREASVAFICNPNNPTGRVETRSTIQSIIDEAQKQNTFVVVDEAFIDFVEKREQHTVMPLVKQYTNLIVLYSMTKFFAIPGLRLGVLLGNVDIIKRLEKAKDPWNVNSLAQIAGAASLRDNEYMCNTRDLIHKEREYLYHSLSRMPLLKVFHGDANYLFIKILSNDISSTSLANITAGQGVLVRDCSSFSGLGKSYLRVAVKTRSENVKLLEALEKALKGA